MRGRWVAGRLPARDREYCWGLSEARAALVIVDWRGDDDYVVPNMSILQDLCCLSVLEESKCLHQLYQNTHSL